jgi:hypothetical protein
MSEKLQSITVEVSPDSVGGDTEITRDEMADYIESLATELEIEYPGVEVTVIESINTRVIVDAGENWNVYSQVGGDVEQLLHEHWQQWIDKVAMR